MSNTSLESSPKDVSIVKNLYENQLYSKSSGHLKHFLRVFFANDWFFVIISQINDPISIKHTPKGRQSFDTTFRIQSTRKKAFVKKL